MKLRVLGIRLHIWATREPYKRGRARGVTRELLGICSVSYCELLETSMSWRGRRTSNTHANNGATCDLCWSSNVSAMYCLFPWNWYNKDLYWKLTAKFGFCKPCFLIRFSTCLCKGTNAICRIVVRLLSERCFKKKLHTQKQWQPSRTIFVLFFIPHNMSTTFHIIKTFYFFLKLPARYP